MEHLPKGNLSDLHANVTKAMSGPVQHDNQQTSAQSIFWALSAIVLSAMLQPSISGYLLNGGSFEGSIWPHRSSPTICIVDAIAEVWILFEKFHGTNQHYEEPLTAKSTNVAMRLTVFIVAVLPQAIKLFCMRGIPITQSIAAIFLASTLVSIARSVCLDAPHKEIYKLADRLKTFNKGILVKAGVGLFGWTLHCIFLYYTWYLIEDVAHIPCCSSTLSTRVIMEFCNAIVTFTSLYMLQHAAFVIIGIKPPIPRYPIIMIILSSNWYSITKLRLDLEVRKSSQKPLDRWKFVVTLLVNLALFSYGLAYTIDKAAKILLKFAAKTSSQPGRSSDWNVHSQPELPLRENRQPRPINGYVTEDMVTSDQSTTNNACPVAQNRVTLPPVEEAPPQLPVGDQESTTQELAIDETVLASTNGTDAVSSSNTPEAEEKSISLLGNIVIHITVWLALCIIIPLHYSRAINFCDTRIEGEPQTTEQLAAEEGRRTEQTTAAEQDTESQRNTVSNSLNLKSIAGHALLYVNEALRFVIKYVVLLIWRFFLALMNLQCYTIRWIHLYHSRDTLAVAFAIVNLSTAIVYYLTLFDGSGTTTQQWTSILG